MMGVNRLDEEEALRKLYQNYLENALNIEYKKVFINKESPLINSRVCLSSKDGVALTEYLDSIIELENGKYFLGETTNEQNEVIYVFFDNEGKEINRIKNVRIDKFYDGIARVTTLGRNPRCGYINVKGELVSEIKWGRGSGDFKCGRARVISEDSETVGKYGFINEEGNLVIPCSSISYYEFSDDVVCRDDGGLKTYFDRDGNKLFSDVLADPYFHFGLVKFQNSKGKWGYKNKLGEVVIKPQFKSAGNFENGLAKVDNGYIDLTGKKVKVVAYDNGIPYIKGLLKMSCYNELTKTYDSFNDVPYKDLGDCLLVLIGQEIGIYSKESRLCTYTGVKLGAERFDISQKGNLLSLNGVVFFLKPNGSVNLSNVLDVKDIIYYEDIDKLVSYEEFYNKVMKDQSLKDKYIEESKKIRETQLQESIMDKKKKQDDKRQEIIEQLESLKVALKNLNETAGALSRIDENMLLHKVDDHLEINSEFLEQLSFLDLSYIDFTNVKVSGIDFSGTNASLDPQLVYQKDMSNGNYRGLVFTSKDFTGVNIKGANFEECNMDFAILDNAIADDTTKFGDTIRF